MEYFEVVLTNCKGHKCKEYNLYLHVICICLKALCVNGSYSLQSNAHVNSFIIIISSESSNGLFSNQALQKMDAILVLKHNKFIAVYVNVLKIKYKCIKCILQESMIYWKFKRAAFENLL